MAKHAGGTPATEALDAAGIAFTLHPYTHHDDTRDFGAEAARELGVDELRIFKTLVVDVGHGRQELAVGVVPVAGQLDLKAFAAALGAKRAAMAKPTDAARSSGYVIGGISPIAQRTPLPTVVDETAQLFDTIYVSAGKRGLQAELSPADLVAVTGGTWADIAR
ncbi:Cys-tRNA(Pro) deacylase [Micropruina sonneratiae]|uniref:Cys-tRNA(Pro) deacylase n=1 Tax=Micropruina sonneratiae TaxID=2986940 RepID=UPI002226AE4C|nr:Cys-tRNA(Pro) deacylase [Micropruina sp. KQZ13P-5]MCW3157774.1 Cys-tRNA(Pro) deacylase [Micropruina sp. KQZ13P-5]